MEVKIKSDNSRYGILYAEKSDEYYFLDVVDNDNYQVNISSLCEYAKYVKIAGRLWEHPENIVQDIKDLLKRASCYVGSNERVGIEYIYSTNYTYTPMFDTTKVLVTKAKGMQTLELKEKHGNSTFTETNIYQDNNLTVKAKGIRQLSITTENKPLITEIDGCILAGTKNNLIESDIRTCMFSAIGQSNHICNIQNTRLYYTSLRCGIIDLNMSGVTLHDLKIQSEQGQIDIDKAYIVDNCNIIGEKTKLFLRDITFEKALATNCRDIFIENTVAGDITIMEFDNLHLDIQQSSIGCLQLFINNLESLDSDWSIKVGSNISVELGFKVTKGILKNNNLKKLLTVLKDSDVQVIVYDGEENNQKEIQQLHDKIKRGII